MGRRAGKRKTSLMRVPDSFKNFAQRSSEKYGYKTTTEWLDKDALKILNNADQLTDWLNVFRRRRK